MYVKNGIVIGNNSPISQAAQITTVTRNLIYTLAPLELYTPIPVLGSTYVLLWAIARQGPSILTIRDAGVDVASVSLTQDFPCEIGVAIPNSAIGFRNDNIYPFASVDVFWSEGNGQIEQPFLSSSQIWTQYLALINAQPEVGVKRHRIL